MYSTPSSRDIDPWIWLCKQIAVNQHTLGYDPKKIIDRTWYGGMKEVSRAPFGLCSGTDVWEMVTHLEGVACTPCLIDLRLDHWVLMRELEVINDL